MKQRIHEIDGTIELTSVPGQGAKVILHCPLSVRHAVFPE
jgi:signal transduction histidine kinase